MLFGQGSSFQWEIGDALTKVNSLESDEFVVGECRWRLHLNVDSQNMSICLEKLNSEKLNRTYEILAFILSYYENAANIFFYMLDDSDFVTEEIGVISRSDLQKQYNIYLTDGTLTFVVVFRPINSLEADAKGEKVSDKSVNVYTVPDLEKLSCDFHRLLDDGAQSDVTLKCGERSFPAHKNILSARSEVFSAMFRSDMEENRTGVIQISDVDASVLNQFLHYVYSGKLPDLSVDTARKLYAAADKYSVELLKILCSKFMQGNLTKDNACKILVLADTHGDKHLKDAVLRFITNVELVQNKDVWMEFHKEHPKLAVEGFYHAYEAKCVSKVN